MGKNRPPLGQSVPPPAPNPPRPARGKKAAAIRAFQADHLAIFGTPSGTITWNITVSKNPRRWFYQAAQTPGQSYHDSQGQPTYHKTNLAVTACIDWPEENAPWLEAVLQQRRLTNLQILPLGASPCTPPHPADRAWQLVCARNDLQTTQSYCGKTHLHTALGLGATVLLTQRPGKLAGDALIEHIRQLSIRRLHRSADLPF